MDGGFGEGSETGWSLPGQQSPFSYNLSLDGTLHWPLKKVEQLLTSPLKSGFTEDNRGRT